MSASYRYFLETACQPVGPGHAAWVAPLPASRTAHPGACTYGDYFLAVRAFFETSGREAVARALRQKGMAPDPAEWRIFLVKHGEHYHPARVETGGAGGMGEWVVNVAVSDAARGLLRREHAVLAALAGRPRRFLPEVYGWGEVECRPGARIACLLAEWFGGFHEFHLTRTPDGGRGVVLWDAEGGNRLLSPSQVVSVYRQAAYILTSYLDLGGFEAIGGWHHAAGDFVVRDGPGAIDVRLVTAREYRPVFGRAPSDLEGLLNACLGFLLQLSLRTRIDRLDGTGDMVWSGPEAVGATVDGVLAALAETPFPEGLPLPFADLFGRYLAGCSAEVLEGLCADVVARSFPPGSIERGLAAAGLTEHVRALVAAFDRS
ncbi:MAG: hypothetical protein MUE48_11835 [Desulfobacterales bacterium]|nr:hypothetical protein [Desulfobacterales bacterium]